RLTVRLAASLPGGSAAAVQIRASGTPPSGASLTTADGNPAHATFSWSPAASQTGDYELTFTASAGLPGTDAPLRTIAIHVGPSFPRPLGLSDPTQETYRWAFVVKRTVAR